MSRFRFSLTLILVFAAFFCRHARASEDRENAPKEIYAHHMGCFPVGTGALVWHRQHDVFRHDDTDPASAVGGRFINWDLVPPGTNLELKDSVRLDIHRAIRAGFDGFAVDAYAGGDGARKVVDLMLEICKEENLPFKITICLDPSCLPKHESDTGKPHRSHAYAQAIQDMLKNNVGNPHLATRGGKLLVFGYVSAGILNVPALRENLPPLVEGYREVERLVGRKIFFHFCMNAFGHDVPSDQKIPLEEAYAWAAKHFPAVGLFFDGYYEDGKVEDYGRIVKQNGAQWSQPMWFQYCNRPNNSTYGKPGFDKLRQMWTMTRGLDSSLLQFVTWNDYGEDTNVAPGYNTNYAVMSLNRIFIDWWKTGLIPKTNEDRIYVSFLKYDRDAVVFPFQILSPRSGVLEVTTFLKEPAQVRLPGRDFEYEAPAGLYHRQFPLAPGTVEVHVLRNGKVCTTLLAPEEITDKPFRWDVSMYAYSTECGKEWEKDFPDKEQFVHAEYADADGDGLPNWFEMYYFGDFRDPASKTAVPPEADPDGDGVSNLEEFRRQTNPLFVEKPYESGYSWNFRSIVGQNRFSNPDFDDRNNPVWHYLYKLSKSGDFYSDEKCLRTSVNSPDISWAGKNIHLSTYREPGYENVMGWIRQHKNEDGTIRTVLKPHAEVAMILGWKSPIDGTVSIRGKILPNPGRGNFRLLHNEKTLVDEPLRNEERRLDLPNPISVRKNDFIYLVAIPPKERYLNDELVVDNYKIVLEEISIKGNAVP